MNNKIIEFNNVIFSYDNKEKILNSISFNMLEGEFISIIGSNGAGKSTILKTMLGEITPDSGNIKLFNTNIKHFKNWEEVGYLEQNAYYRVLNFPATVYEVVVSNLYKEIGLFKFPKKSHYQKVINALEIVGMEKYSKTLISKLSGGQIQRVFLARTLIKNPKLLILDEPTTAIDINTVNIIYDILYKLNKENNTSIIMVSHDLKYLSKISSKILCFEEGSLIELEKGQLEKELSHKHKHP